MVYYLAKSKFIIIFFILSNIAIISAVWLAELLILLKLIIISISLVLNYKSLLKHYYIKGFYLDPDGISLLLTKDNKEIKVKYFKVAYFNSFLVILCFKKYNNIIRIIVFKDAVELNKFKRLQLLARFAWFHTALGPI